jgi:hypothetical protein
MLTNTMLSRNSHLNKVCEIVNERAIIHVNLVGRNAKDHDYKVNVNLDGIFWHPLSTDNDLQVSCPLFHSRSRFSKFQSNLYSPLKPVVLS